jgi:hypothetical protein
VVLALVGGSYYVTTHQDFASHDDPATVPWDRATNMNYAEACAPRPEDDQSVARQAAGLMPGVDEVDALGEALDAIGASKLLTYGVVTNDGRVYNLPCSQPPPEGVGADWYSYTPVEPGS